MPQPSLRWSGLDAGPSISLPSRLLAALLLHASRLLARSARSLAAPRPRPRPSPADRCLAFYAEAGAPEGALYLDGELVGRPGARRL